MFDQNSHDIMSDEEPDFDLELHSNFTPAQCVAELDKYVISQDDAKRAVAIALRNRWRRMRVPSEMRDEITPKNILMIGPTGVGKTEISRRLAKLAHAPFVKVEASKFTEVGYVGRDVESIIRDLLEVSLNQIRDEERKRVTAEAETTVEEQLLDLLLPSSNVRPQEPGRTGFAVMDDLLPAEQLEESTDSATRARLREMLREGKLDERIVELELQKQMQTHFEILGPPGFAEIEGQLKDMFTNMIPKAKEKKTLSVKEARKALLSEEQENLLDQDAIVEMAVRRAEQSGIVFIDEIDKICGEGAHGRGPDVSREGVQRDLLPLVEGCTVSTKYGPVRTDYILFVASGAFHFSKPSDLMPEFQGRFPIRVELKSLTPEHFIRILTEPKNALVSQYQALMKTEGVDLRFTDEAIRELARLTAEVNSRTENIGARRLHTLLERVLDDISYNAHERGGETVTIDEAFVRERLGAVVEDVDLSRFIL